MSVIYQSPPEWRGRTDPEDGDRAQRFYHLMGDGNRALIGFACDVGVSRNQGRSGASEGPSAIRQALASVAVPINAPLISDLGTVAVEGDDLEAGQTELSAVLAKALTDHNRVLVMGGGHETAFGSFSGLRQAHPEAQIGIINFDAHLDLRAIGEAGPSSGTPFYQIHQMDPDRFDYLCIGAASESNTQALLDRAKDLNVGIVSDKEVNTDIDAGYAAIRSMIDRSDLIYLTIDLDLMPSEQAPGVSAPAARGVPFTTVETLVAFVLSEATRAGVRVPLADIVELSPPFDQDGRTAKRAAYLARQILLAD